MASIIKVVCAGFLLLFVLTACYAEDGDNITVDEFNLTLQDGFLVYKHKGLIKKLDLELTGEVNFIKNRNGMPQIEQTKWGIVVAVANSTRIPKSNDCHTIIKGIVIKNSQVHISPKIQNIAMCGFGPQDSLMFVDFAYALHIRMEKKKKKGANL